MSAVLPCRNPVSHLRNNPCMETAFFGGGCCGISDAPAFSSSCSGACAGVPKKMGIDYNYIGISGGIYNKDDFSVSVGRADEYKL